MMTIEVVATIRCVLQHHFLFRGDPQWCILWRKRSLYCNFFLVVHSPAASFFGDSKSTQGNKTQIRRKPEFICAALLKSTSRWPPKEKEAACHQCNFKEFLKNRCTLGSTIFSDDLFPTGPHIIFDIVNYSLSNPLMFSFHFGKAMIQLFLSCLHCARKLFPHSIQLQILYWHTWY